MMLSSEEDVEAHALRKQGWNISQIAKHSGPGPQDDPGISERGTCPGGASPVGAGPVRRGRRLSRSAAGGRSARVGVGAVR